MTEVLSRKQLNRALLSRQMLLQRQPRRVVDTVELLAGLQAQEPGPPFLGLWTRLLDFQPEDLLGPLQRRELVRATLMRATLHLVSARDYLLWRPQVGAVMNRAMSAIAGRSEGMELEALLPRARELLAEKPRTFQQLRELLQQSFPEVNERALGYAVRLQLPLVMVPDQSRWGFPSVAEFTLAESWLGQKLAEGSVEPLVRSYLGAFGPATPGDLQAWSGLTGIKATLDGMRDHLVSFRDEGGNQLFDLPEAPRPDAGTMAPVRYLPEFDNLVLSHKDRSRILAEAHRPLVVTKNLRVRSTFLVDGFVAGSWELERQAAGVTLKLTPFESLPSHALEELEDEGLSMLRFLAPDARAHTFALTN